MTADTEQKVWTAFAYPDDKDPYVVARRILDKLIVVAKPVFDIHAGDLIFDYEWLKKYAQPAKEGAVVRPIYWSWDDSGTLIGDDRHYIANKPNLYKVQIPAPIRGRIDIYISKEQ